jgi:hypothetical protein
MVNRGLWLVRSAGIEPARGCPRGILSPLCLPVPPRAPSEWGDIGIICRWQAKSDLKI